MVIGFFILETDIENELSFDCRFEILKRILKYEMFFFFMV